MRKKYLNEFWKDIEGFEGLYQISNYGRVKSLPRNTNNQFRTGLIKRLQKDKCGYLSVILHKDGISKKVLIHRLVATAFIPNPNNYLIVNHKNEDKLNNFVWVNDDGTVDLDKSNLEWCTQLYNVNYGTGLERMVQNRTGKTARKSVLQFDLNGNFIKEWECAHKIVKDTGFSQSYICCCCNGKYRQAYGFVWKYK